MCISTYKYLIALVGSTLVLFMENYNVFFLGRYAANFIHNNQKKKIMLVDRFFMLTLHKTKMIT